MTYKVDIENTDMDSGWGTEISLTLEFPHGDETPATVWAVADAVVATLSTSEMALGATIMQTNRDTAVERPS
jgi:hypothetical protein